MLVPDIFKLLNLFFNKSRLVYAKEIRNNMVGNKKKIKVIIYKVRKSTGCLGKGKCPGLTANGSRSFL